MKACLKNSLINSSNSQEVIAAAEDIEAIVAVSGEIIEDTAAAQAEGNTTNMEAVTATNVADIAAVKQIFLSTFHSCS